jgi:hypothetical protein
MGPLFLSSGVLNFCTGLQCWLWTSSPFLI